MNNKKNLKGIITLAAMFLLALYISGCGDTASVTESNTTDNVSVSVKTDNGALNPSSIIIDEAKALLTEIEVEQEPSGTEHEIRIKPVVIYFNLSGTVISVTSGSIPEGTYNKIKFQLHKPEDNEPIPDPEFREGSSGNQRYSFIIKGRYNGNNFVFKSRRSANLVVIFPSGINFQQFQRNITMIINPSLWFIGPSGELDPTNEASRDQIEDNIKNSFKRAFKDDDRNGEPD